MKNKNLYIIFIITVVIILAGTGIYFLAGNNHSHNTSSIAATTDTVKMSFNSQFDTNILTNAAGITLYHFLKDFSGSAKGVCTGQCAALWPAFYADNILVSPPLKASQFASITRADGTKQTTYRGWPLYYYANDHVPGDINGQGIDNIWYAGITPN